MESPNPDEKPSAVDLERVRELLDILHSLPIVDDCDWQKELYDENGLPR